MRNGCLLVLLFIGLSTSAQKLNKYGKIVLDEIPKAPDFYRIKNDDNNKILYKDSLTFEGNEFYKLPNAFIANDETADNKPDKINYYNSEGKLVFSILTPRIINFKTSINGNYAAFYNQSAILLVNLNTIYIDTLFGSHSFAFTNKEEFIYFDSEERLIAYKDQIYSCEEFPSMFLDFNSNILVFTSSKMMQLSGYDFINVREFEGVFHDARIIDDTLYLVEKLVKRKNVIYTLYKTKDLLNFEIIEKSDYK
ncbi:MAG: hypothetical protein AB7S50_07775 [Bacteroidales bacterium]